MSNVIHQTGDGDSACEGILLGLHFWIDCRYRLPSNQLPFTIYHLSFIIAIPVSIWSRPIRRQWYLSTPQRVFWELRLYAREKQLLASPGLSKQSEGSQPPNQDPQHPQPSNKSQSDNYFPGLSNAFCSFFFCSDPIESSRPLVLSSSRYTRHTHTQQMLLAPTRIS